MTRDPWAKPENSMGNIYPNEPLRTAMDLLDVLAESYPDGSSEATILYAARNIAAKRALELYGAQAGEWKR